MKTPLGVGLLVEVVEYCHGRGAKMPRRPELSKNIREARKSHFASGLEIQRIPPKAWFV